MTILNQVRNLTKHSAVYTVATFIQRLQGLILLPILTDVSYLATKSEFGDYALIYTFIAFMNVFYLYGLDTAFLRYYFLGEDAKETIYRSTFQFLTITAFIFSAMVYLSAGPLGFLIFDAPGYEFFVHIAAGILFLDTLCNIPYLILRAEERSTIYTVVRVGRFLLELFLNILFVVFFKQGVKGILYANLLAALINLLVLLPFQIRYLRGSYAWPVVRKLLRFGLPMVPNSVAFLIVEISDRYLMPRLLNKDILGTYTANYKLGTIMLLLVTAFRTAWQPFFLKVAREKDNLEIYSRVMTYYILMAGFVVLGVTFFIEDIVKIPLIAGFSILGADYWSGIKIIPIILLSYLFYGIYVNLTIGIYIKKKSELMVLFTGLAAITNFGSNLYLMPAYGMLGAAAATLLAYVVMAVSIFIANQRIYPVRYEYGRIFWLFCYLIGSLVVYYIFYPPIWLRLVLLAAMPFLIVVLGLFKEDEKALLKRILKNKSRER
jgi:O-antigen/teichoic acid export membrane protein